MNLQECKDQVARNHRYKDYSDYNMTLLINISRHDFNHEVTLLYATEKVKEALSEMLKRGSYVSAKATHDLETELIELINKEK